jgi:hypothetical protein
MSPLPSPAAATPSCSGYLRRAPSSRRWTIPPGAIRAVIARNWPLLWPARSMFLQSSEIFSCASVLLTVMM